MQIWKMRLIQELMRCGAPKHVPIYIRVGSGALVPVEVGSVELCADDELSYIAIKIDAPDV
jgi:hypothetical protein